ncbi:ATPase, partial [Pseudomonas sp. BGM005]|nr:ATPase [Pseudomonas sp. BG5]
MPERGNRPDRWSRVSSSPTNPGTGLGVRELTAEDLFRPAEASTVPLDERLRQVYYWIVNRAVISPYYDMEFSHGEPLSIELG